ncbi:4Fe-4S dicluster domain-containing protein [Pseudomonas sp. PDM31]|uniref:indolepyruvate ferredoxin oxidoreductase subunit alpha n=1 Tax=Pseudomonas sp. PDM31 TaxID=2854778 RepID=UPI001C48FCFA|nr:4Fe-4S dicluster domain-containing protein [Pseudomonas sp. PDM31]MBV7477633.1 4Fe-4S dicluster domain-containing protein [Pseudomonas sp. PDM31]
MAYVIAAPCVADYSCVEICPVGAISPGPDDADFENVTQMYINPTVCVDCAVCLDACPVLAIYESDRLPPKWRHYARINHEYFVECGQ